MSDSMINYERNLRQVIQKRTYPKFGDHGLSGRPVLRVAFSLIVGPARGQNPQLRVPVWPRAEKVWPKLLHQESDKAVRFTTLSVKDPFTPKESKDCHVYNKKIMSCVENMIERHLLCPRRFNEPLVRLDRRWCR